MSEETHVLVLGGGPGGYVTAIRLRQLGAAVTLVERRKVGGVCLNVGCIPSKALIHVAQTWWDLKEKLPALGIAVDNQRLDWAAAQAFKDAAVEKLTGGVAQLLKGNGVKVLYGDGRFTGPHALEVTFADGAVQEVHFSHAVVATGSEATELPHLPYHHPRIGHATHALSYREVPNRLTVVGGGYIGMELGQAYAALGSRVTVVEMLPDILSGADPEAVRMVKRNLKAMGVTLMTQAAVTGFEDKGDCLVLAVESNGVTTGLEADQVLVSVGRRPNTTGIGLEHLGVAADRRGFVTVDASMNTGVAHVFAIGDITGPPYLAHRASAQGEVAAAAIAGDAHTHRPDPGLVPGVVFTMPEIASVGLQEHEAKARGVEAAVGKFPYGGNGKAITGQAETGVVKILCDPATDRILGATVVGEAASAMIGGLAAAVGRGLSSHDLADTVHPHPTLSEMVMEAAKAVHGEAIHTLVRRK